MAQDPLIGAFTRNLTVIHSVPTWLPLTETWLHSQVRWLPEDIVSHIFCERTENLEQFKLPNVHNLSQISPWHYRWDRAVRLLGFRTHLGSLVREARRCHAQILHSHFGNMGWRNIGVSARTGMPHVVSFYGYDVNYLPKLNPVWHKRFRELFVQARLILCEGPHMASCIMKLGCPPHKIRVHRLGIGTAEIQFKPRRWEAHKPLRVLIACSFQEKKGIPYAIEALGRIAKTIPLEVTIIGDANQEPRSQAEKDNILAAIQNCHVGSKVRLLGYQPHTVLLEQAYQHHIFVSPSVTAADGDTEGGAPVTILEMAATGLPVISSRHCDIPEIIQDGVTGFLAPERDVDALCAALRRLIDDRENWDTVTTAARRHIERQFNARRQGTSLADIYRQVIGA
jgi:colanic acid/amylovoran biosynthesis glycosyltransferase